jgi:hypothetical protein
VHCTKMRLLMSVQGQIRPFGDVGSMSGLPESGHGWAIYEPAVGGRAERPTKKGPARRGAGVKEAGVGLSRLLRSIVPAEARSNRQPRFWLHLFGLIQLCGLLREKKVCTSDIWRSRRSSS